MAGRCAGEAAPHRGERLAGTCAFAQQWFSGGRPAAKCALKVPAGFEVRQFASGLSGPRTLRVAPNGDIFVAETGAGRIRVLRPAQDGAGASATDTFASGLRQPFGIALYPADDPQWVYVGNTDSVVRFPYRSGDLKARVAPK